jgi:hypothetical protein
MKYFISTLLFFLPVTNFYFSNTDYYSLEQTKSIESKFAPVITQVLFDPNNISTWFISTGIFNQDLRTSNTPGFMWPKGTNRFAIFSTGLTIAAMFNGSLRMAAASYKGEYTPGYVVDSSGIPVARTDSHFKIYKVTPGGINDPDWQNWGYMVPYGAPFVDMNNNNIYEPQIDKPGVRDAAMTLFLCMTDGFPSTHQIGEGFGGGTQPLFAEVHMTAWAYISPGFEDVNFVKWQIINKSHNAWNSTYFSIVCDADLGYSDDDYIGCDTARQFGFCYNGDNDDAGSPYSYGPNPPAVGIDLFQSAINRSVNPPKTLNMTSFTYYTNNSTPGPICEKDPNGEPQGAYYFMKGVKKDGSPWLIPPGGTSHITKFCYTGDPETGLGWNEGVPGTPSGSIQNCGGLNGNYVPINPVGDRRFLINSGADNFTVNPGETQTLAIGQMIARGSSNLNSVTRLKQLDNVVQNFYNLIGVEQISSNVPSGFSLSQNYPNPFNPSTTIKFDIPYVKSKNSNVKIVVYDILGKQLADLVNKELSPGSYKVDWNASNYPSGVYFCELITDGFFQTRKMVLIK